MTVHDATTLAARPLELQLDILFIPGTVHRSWEHEESAHRAIGDTVYSHGGTVANPERLEVDPTAQAVTTTTPDDASTDRAPCCHDAREYPAGAFSLRRRVGHVTCVRDQRPRCLRLKLGMSNASVQRRAFSASARTKVKSHFLSGCRAFGINRIFRRPSFSQTKYEIPRFSSRFSGVPIKINKRLSARYRSAPKSARRGDESSAMSSAS
jgi:hypothetical protein